MATSPRRASTPRHGAVQRHGTAVQPRLHPEAGARPEVPATGSRESEASEGVWFWLRYPVFAAVAATILEVGTLAGAPLSSPFVPGDWRFLRWLVFFVAMLLLAIPLFGTIDRGGFRRIGEWATGDRGRHVWATLVTFAIGIAVAVGVGLLVAALGPPRAPGDVRLPAIWGLIGGAAVMGILQYRLLTRRVEWAFLLVCLTAGFALQVALPPYTNLVADDRAHYQAALGISYVLDGQFAPQEAVAAEVAIDPAPWDGGIAEDALIYDELGRMFSWEGRQAAIAFLDADVSSDPTFEGLVWPEGSEPEPGASGFIEVEGFSNVRGDSYVKPNLLGRLPLAAGLWTGRLLGLPASGCLVAARTANLLFYAIVTFLAIRTLRSGRLVLLLVALFPSIVMLASNLSYDPFIISLLFLGVARFARVIEDGGVFTPGNLLRILVPLFLGVAVKATYFPMLGLVFLAPERCYATERGAIPRRTVIAAAAAAAGLLILSFLVPMILSGGASTTDRSKFSETSSFGQIAYILQHPLRTVRMVLAWFVAFLTPDSLQAGFTDNLLIHEVSETQVYAVIGGPTMDLSIYLMLFGPLFLRKAGDGAYRTRALVVGTVALFFATVFLTALALYLSYTPVGADTIIGVQVRYLFPLLFPLLLLSFNPRVRMGARWTTVTGVVVVAEALLLLAHLGWGVFGWIA